MSDKGMRDSVEEVRRYLLGEIPMLVSRPGEGIASAKPTYFAGKLDRNSGIWKFIVEFQANPERFEAHFEAYRLGLLAVKSK